MTFKLYIVPFSFITAYQLKFDFFNVLKLTLWGCPSYDRICKLPEKSGPRRLSCGPRSVYRWVWEEWKACEIISGPWLNLSSVLDKVLELTYCAIFIDLRLDIHWKQMNDIVILNKIFMSVQFKYHDKYLKCSKKENYKIWSKTYRTFMLCF